MESPSEIFAVPENTVPTFKWTSRKVRMVNHTANCRIEVNGARIRLFHKGELDTTFNTTDIIAVDISGRGIFEVKIAILPGMTLQRKHLPQIIYDSGVAVITLTFASLDAYNQFLGILFAAGIFMPVILPVEVIGEIKEKGWFHLLKRLPPVRKYVNDANIVTEMFPDWTVRNYAN